MLVAIVLYTPRESMHSSGIIPKRLVRTDPETDLVVGFCVVQYTVYFYSWLSSGSHSCQCIYDHVVLRFGWYAA